MAKDLIVHRSHLSLGMPGGDARMTPVDLYERLARELGFASGDTAQLAASALLLVLLSRPELAAGTHGRQLLVKQARASLRIVRK